MTTSSAVREHREDSEADATTDAVSAFRADVLAGLDRPDKSLSCKYFYDARGSQLFDRICETPEYYPTRTELAIMREHAPEMARAIPPGSVLIEYGSGSSIKTRLLLDHLQQPAGYAPVDVSREHLLAASRSIATDYPHIPVFPICADFTRPFGLPPEIPRQAPRVVYFPGSTLGNFTPPSDLELLRGIAKTVGVGGAAIVGLDLQKSPEVIEAAYNDAQGVTSEFNLNLLARMNRELDADFNIDAFAHRAVYNRELGRIETYIDSQVAQTVHIAGRPIEFQAGESIHTEYSCKYTLPGFADLAASAGFSVARNFVDAKSYFCVVHLVAN